MCSLFGRHVYCHLAGDAEAEGAIRARHPVCRDGGRSLPATQEAGDAGARSEQGGGNMYNVDRMSDSFAKR